MLCYLHFTLIKAFNSVPNKWAVLQDVRPRSTGTSAINFPWLAVMFTDLERGVLIAKILAE